MAKRFLTTLNLSPSTSDPATGSEGDAYFNSSSNKIRVYYDGAWNDLAGGGGGSSNSFETISTPSGTSPVADSATDTLSITAGTGMIITGSSSTDTIDFATNATALNTASTIVARDSNQAFDITAIDFDTTDTISSAVGRLAWDDGEGTLNFGLKGGNVNLQVGQENIALCYNGTGSTITKGSVVYISGAQGQRPSITLSDADTEATSSKTFGVAAENISNGAEGFVCTFGVVTGVNTSSFTAGQALWLSSTAGQLTNVVPTQPAHAVFVGYCLSVNASSGRIFVNPQNGYELQELHNVLINGIADNHIISYDNATSLWKNQALVDAIKEVDGASSGIDADLLDGQDGSYYLDWTNATNKPDPTITLGGDLSGSITLTDLAGGTLTATIAANSVALGTDTTGDYVASVSGTDGVSISGTGEGASVTVSNTDKGSSQNIFKNVLAGSTTIIADSNDDTLTVSAGTGIGIQGNATTDTITISNEGVTGISGTTNQITASGSTGSVTLSLPSAVTFPGTVTLNADPTQDLQAATKQYVDAVAQGLHIHASCATATTTNISSFSSPPSSIDGVTLTTSMRVLVKNQSTTSENGIYVFNGTSLTRATDFDSSIEIDGGDFVFVTGGTVNDNTGWVQTETVGTVGSDPILFTQFSGAGTYTAGNGLTLSSTQFSINTAITADLSTAQTLTNKTINGANNTLTVRLANDITGFGTGVATFLATPTSSNLATAVTDKTGSGSLVFATSPTLVTPTLGVASATSINKVAITSPATSATLTIADGATLATSGAFSITLTATAATNVTLPTSGTLATTTQALQWDGGSTNLVATTGRTSLGATTVGSNIFTLTNPSAITFLKINADNTVTAESASTFKTSLSLNNVENTALSTWAGSSNITTLGTIATLTLSTADSSATASHYFIETASDGVIRPKTLANVRTEIVTNTVIQAAVVSPTSAGSTGVRNVTVSTSAATGGSDGDVWLVYV